MIGVSRVEFKNYDKKLFEKDNSAKILFNYLDKVLIDRSDCTCYYRNPIYFIDGKFNPSLVIIDREYGIIVFKTYDYTDDQLTTITENYWELKEERVANDLINFEDYCYRFKNDLFQPRYKLNNKVEFNSFVCFPFMRKNIKSEEYLFDNILLEDFESVKIFESLKKKKLMDEQWKSIISIVQKANVLDKVAGYKVGTPLKTLNEAIIYNEQQISVLDKEQEEAAMQIPQGIERIRGLAGTGKTIILAMKAARIHYDYPDEKILFTFYTQALYNQIRNLISRFYYKLKQEEPNWENIHILHSWGSKERAGVYRNACIKNGYSTTSYGEVQNEASPFGKACEKILNCKLEEEYDYILIDEAQDLPIPFFKLIDKIAKNPKRIVYAYDDLQTTGDVRVAEPNELFYPDTVLENDYILKKSYRNHGKVLHTAIALGFGIYKEGGISQIADKETWEAIGYNIRPSSKFTSGEWVEIERPEENSPNRIDQYFPDIEIIMVKPVDTMMDESEAVWNKIIELITKQKVKPHDIIVVDLDTRYAKNRLSNIAANLFQRDIDSKMPGIIDNASDFFCENNVTLTTARRAKGNEAPIIFIMGVNKIYEQSSRVDERIMRNFAFISLTRSKGWCFISGYGDSMELFNVEYEKIKADFKLLKFKYPTDDEMREIVTINYIAMDQNIQAEYYNQIEMIKKLTGGDPNLLKVIPQDLKEKLKAYIEKMS